MRFKEYRLFQNLWRETLLLNHFRTEPQKVAQVYSFGQLPGSIIYRQVEEVWGTTLDLFIKNQFAVLLKPHQPKTHKSEPTVFTEIAAIDLILKVINLVSMLHEKQLVHTNLCPKEIFLKEGKIDQMCFLNLYHAYWNPKQVLKIDLPNVQETTLKYDMRTRNTEFISPEQ
jgi:tRNA A-37 threonylcarbamoyl transferase component Bud32